MLKASAVGSSFVARVPFASASVSASQLGRYRSRKRF
jgi:hypothetical protein